MIVHRAFYMGHLVIPENKFGVIEIDFNTQAFSLVEKIPDAVVILRNGNGFTEEPVVPSFTVMTGNSDKSKIIAQGGLVDIYVTARIPFGVIAPGEIKFAFSWFFSFLRLAKEGEEHRCEYKMPAHKFSLTHAGV